MPRTLYVGDVHGCADELEALLDAAQADRVVLLGDLFTRGPDPGRVWELLGAHALESLSGNHDAHVLRLLESGGALEGPMAQLEPVREAVRVWLAGLPWFLQDGDILAVHAGVHPTLGLAGTTPRIARIVRRWPDDRDPNNPFWYDAGWAGPERVVFGHDAVRGLVRRERGGRLVALGLDTGCVYGGALTGWLAEEDRLLQVPARGVWYSWS